MQQPPLLQAGAEGVCCADKVQHCLSMQWALEVQLCATSISQHLSIHSSRAKEIPLSLSSSKEAAAELHWDSTELSSSFHMEKHLKAPKPSQLLSSIYKTSSNLQFHTSLSTRSAKLSRSSSSSSQATLLPGQHHQQSTLAKALSLTTSPASPLLGTATG